MFKNAIFLFFISLVSGQVWANCDAVVEEMSKEETPTTSFLALLQNMIEKQYMSVDQYQILINSIEAGKIKIPWNQGNLSAHSSLRLYGNLVADYLTYWGEHPEYLEAKTLVKMGRENLKKWGREAVERSEAKDETKIPILKMESVKIPAGKLKLKDERGEREIGLLQDVEVQKYVVTQAMWVELMGENPSYFAKGDNEITIELHGKKITMQPNNPVEKINWLSALIYANRLSEKEGYKPVYDFSQVTKFKGRAEAGDYEVLEGGVRINETDGYRLPTQVESEYVIRGGTTTKFSFGDDYELLNQYGWFNGNSDAHSHPVGEKLPNPFGLYDVHGNVSELLADHKHNTLSEQFYSHVFTEFFDNSVRIAMSNGLSGFCVYDSAVKSYWNVGFRLIRRLGKP